MTITINGKPKEIAALVLEVQKRRAESIVLEQSQLEKALDVRPSALDYQKMMCEALRPLDRTHTNMQA